MLRAGGVRAAREKPSTAKTGTRAEEKRGFPQVEKGTLAEHGDGHLQGLSLAHQLLSLFLKEGDVWWHRCQERVFQGGVKDTPNVAWTSSKIRTEACRLE